MTEQQQDATASSGAPSIVTSSVPLEPTGVPGLDDVLGGGIQRGSLAILAGPPGGGKTILAHHIAFSAARYGRRTAILTAFSEPTNKLIAHMRPFAFFDQELLGQTLEVLSIQQFLRQGLTAATDEILGAVRSAKARLVILDGFRGVRETADQPEEARRFIYDVSNRLSLLGVTLLLTSEANVRDADFFPEATTADVLLGLAFDAIEARERRTLEVLKARGAAPLNGRHALTIGDEGITIYPRLEARMARLVGANRPFAGQTGQAISTMPSVMREREQKQTYQQQAHRETGVPGLDALVGDGFASGASALVVGERGVGKTLFALQFARSGVSSGEPVLFVSFRETARDLLRLAAPFAWRADLERALEADAFTLLRVPPIELAPDVLASNILTLLDVTNARRLVLDEVGEIERALAAAGYAHRFPDFLAAFAEALRLRNVTTVFTAHCAARSRTELERQLDLFGPLGLHTEHVFWLRQRVRNAELHRSMTRLAPGAGGAVLRCSITIQAPAGLCVATGVPDAGTDMQIAARANSTRRTANPDEEQAHGA